MILITVSGSRGAGKGTILTILSEHFGSRIYRIVPCTTRAPREGEQHGKHMYFITKPEFEEFEQDGKLVYASPKIDGKYRSGTLVTELSKAPVSVVDITSEGAKILRNAVLNMGGKSLCILLWADSAERYKRIKNRQPDLTADEIHSMIKNDPTDPWIGNHPDFFFKVHNPNGKLEETKQTIVSLIEDFLTENA